MTDYLSSSYVPGELCPCADTYTGTLLEEGNSVPRALILKIIEKVNSFYRPLYKFKSIEDFYEDEGTCIDLLCAPDKCDAILASLVNEIRTRIEYICSNIILAPPANCDLDSDPNGNIETTPYPVPEWLLTGPPPTEVTWSETVRRLCNGEAGTAEGARVDAGDCVLRKHFEELLDNITAIEQNGLWVKTQVRVACIDECGCPFSPNSICKFTYEYPFGPGGCYCINPDPEECCSIGELGDPFLFDSACRPVLIAKYSIDLVCTKSRVSGAYWDRVDGLTFAMSLPTFCVDFSKLCFIDSTYAFSNSDKSWHYFTIMADCSDAICGDVVARTVNVQIPLLVLAKIKPDPEVGENPDCSSSCSPCTLTDPACTPFVGTDPCTQSSSSSSSDCECGTYCATFPVPFNQRCCCRYGCNTVLNRVFYKLEYSFHGFRDANADENSICKSKYCYNKEEPGCPQPSVPPPDTSLVYYMTQITFDGAWPINDLGTDVFPLFRLVPMNYKYRFTSRVGTGCSIDEDVSKEYIATRSYLYPAIEGNLDSPPIVKPRWFGHSVSSNGGEDRPFPFQTIQGTDIRGFASNPCCGTFGEYPGPRGGQQRCLFSDNFWNVGGTCSGQNTGVIIQCCVNLQPCPWFGEVNPYSDQLYVELETFEVVVTQDTNCSGGDDPGYPECS